MIAHIITVAFNLLLEKIRHSLFQCFKDHFFYRIIKREFLNLNELERVPNWHCVELERERRLIFQNEPTLWAWSYVISIDKICSNLFGFSLFFPNHNMVWRNSVNIKPSYCSMSQFYTSQFTLYTHYTTNVL